MPEIGDQFVVITAAEGVLSGNVRVNSDSEITSNGWVYIVDNNGQQVVLTVARRDCAIFSSCGTCSAESLCAGWCAMSNQCVVSASECVEGVDNGDCKEEPESDTIFSLFSSMSPLEAAVVGLSSVLVLTIVGASVIVVRMKRAAAHTAAGGDAVGDNDGYAKDAYRMTQASEVPQPQQHQLRMSHGSALTAPELGEPRCRSPRRSPSGGRGRSRGGGRQRSRGRRT